VRDHLKVLPVHAQAVATFVIDLLAWWDRPVLDDVHDDVDRHGAAIHEHDLIPAVSVAPVSALDHAWLA